MIEELNKLGLHRRIAPLILLIVLISAGAEIGASCGSNGQETSTVERNKETRQNQSQKSDWHKEPGKIMANLTSTSSLVLPNKNIRTYFVDNGFISFMESEDGTSFGEIIRTNIGNADQAGTEEVPAEPVVVLLRSGRFMMLYNTGRSENQLLGKPQYTKLHLAYSKDGIRFDYQGIAGDVDKDQHAVVNQIDAIVLSEGSIRIYGADNGISTAISKDGGRTWITDGLRFIGENAAEPAVYSDRSGKYIMYYSTSDEKPNQLRTHIGKAQSADGLDWKLLKTDHILAERERKAIFNPDHVILSAQTEIMFYSEATLKESQMIQVEWRKATKTSQ